jgi:NAD(P)H dehydrogenase (quinone)
LILQFPLWWFAMPAILKDWVDRVLAYGFAYGVGEHSDRLWGDRYGEGTLAGTRAMLIVTAGGWASIILRAVSRALSTTYCSQSITGFSIIRTTTCCRRFVTFSTDHFHEMRFKCAAESLRSRMRTLETTRRIPYRLQNGRDYHIPAMQLRAELGDPAASGFALHLKDVAGSS